MTSKFLCMHHNQQLSPLDQAGKEFLTAVKRSFDAASGEGEFSNEAFFIEGDKLELWLIKVLCGILTGSRHHRVPEEWIEILFQRRHLPDGAGMHIFGKPGPAGWYFNLLRVISVKGNRGNIAGAKFGIGGLALLLAFGRPRFSESGFESSYRPESFLIHKGSNTKRLDFSWGCYEGAGSVFFRIEGIIEEQDAGPKPIVKPHARNK